MKNWKLGEKTKEIWAGDLISECEFISDIKENPTLNEGRMIFYDLTFKCFRLVYYQWLESDKKHILNGWLSAKSPSELLEVSLNF